MQTIIEVKEIYKVPKKNKKNQTMCQGTNSYTYKSVDIENKWISILVKGEPDEHLVRQVGGKDHSRNWTKTFGGQVLGQVERRIKGKNQDEGGHGKVEGVRKELKEKGRQERWTGGRLGGVCGEDKVSHRKRNDHHRATGAVKEDKTENLVLQIKTQMSLIKPISLSIFPYPFNKAQIPSAGEDVTESDANEKGASVNVRCIVEKLQIWDGKTDSRIDKWVKVGYLSNAKGNERQGN